MNEVIIMRLLLTGERMEEFGEVAEWREKT
jgi:hypothetical protein